MRRKAELLRAVAPALIALALLVTSCAQQQLPQKDPFQKSLNDSVQRTREQRQAYVDSHPSLPAGFRTAIMQGQVLPGMSKEDVMGIEGGNAPPVGCPRSLSTTGEMWDYCVHSMRIGPLVTPEAHEIITFDSSGKVVSVSKSGAGPLRDARLGGAPY
jgi:hypothetical protein